MAERNPCYIYSLYGMNMGCVGMYVILMLAQVGLYWLSLCLYALIQFPEVNMFKSMIDANPSNAKKHGTIHLACSVSFCVGKFHNKFSDLLYWTIG